VTSTQTTELKRSLSTAALFALGFGHIVGVGWITIMGEWLENAGPGGAVMAIVSVGAAMCFIGVCYGTVARLIPRAGAEIAYAYKCFGELPAYLTGWIIALYAICVVAFLGISFSLFLKALIPGIGEAVAYVAFGKPVTHLIMLSAVGGCAVLTAANLVGSGSVFRAQTIMTVFLITVVFILFATSLTSGDFDNMQPLLPPSSGLSGFMAVVVMLPFFYGGFQLIPQMLEERVDRDGFSAGTVIVAAILTATLFYALVVIAVSLAVPYAQVIGEELPTYAAMKQGLSNPFGEVVLLAGLLGILTSWNSAFVWGVRVIFALGRAHLIAPVFGTVHSRRKTPTAAIVLVGASSLGLSVLGSGVLVPIVTIASSLISSTMLITALCAWRLHGTTDASGKIARVPGGRGVIAAAIAIAAGLTLYSIAQPIIDANANPELGSGIVIVIPATAMVIPPETIGLLVWLIAGVVLYAVSARGRSRLTRAQRASIIGG